MKAEKIKGFHCTVWT